MATRVLGMSSADRNIKYLNNHISFGFSIFFNVLLLLCVFKRTSVYLKPYRKVLLFYVFVDCCFTLTNWLFYPLYINFEFNGTLYTLQVLWGVFDDVEQPGTSIVMLISTFFRNYYTCAVAVHFVYRYCIICQGHQLRWPSFGALCLLACTGPLIYAVCVYQAQWEQEFQMEKMEAMFVDTDWMNNRNDIPEFVALNWRQTLHLNFIPPFVAIVCYAIVVACSIAMTRKMRALRQLQNGTAHSAHSQLLRVLVVQALLPLITSVIPTMLLQSTRAVGLSTPSFVRPLFLLNPWSPVLNPVCAIIFIAPYRRFVFHPFRNIFALFSEHTVRSPKGSDVQRVSSHMLKVVV